MRQLADPRAVRVPPMKPLHGLELSVVSPRWRPPAFTILARRVIKHPPRPREEHHQHLRTADNHAARRPTVAHGG
jgi:hypothetical protein